MNLSGFKKLKEDKKTVTMGHPAGHSIVIAKGALPALQRKQLERIPLHLDEGGAIEDSEPDSVIDNNVSSLANAAHQFTNALPDISGALKGDQPDATLSGALNQAAKDTSDTAVAATEPSPVAEAKELPAADANLPGAGSPVGGSNNGAGPAPSSIAPTSSGPVDINKAYAQGQQAITEQQNVSAQIAKNQADIGQQDIDARKALAASADQNAKIFQQHQQQFINDYMNNHVNPNHYLENMGTGQKVATAIGLLLGGFTGGFNKTGVNPASDWLNAQINRDIKGQESRMDQQKTVLGANQELYHDQVLAQNATRMNMNDLYDHQIQVAAQKLGTPAAKAAADAQHAKFAMENAQLLRQNSIRATTADALQRGGAGVDPILLGQAGFMSPEEAQKEQSAFNTHKAGIQRINDLYNQANKEQTTLNTVNPESYKAVDAINSQLINTLMAMDVNHRYSPEAAKALLTPNLIKTTDDERVRALKQNNVLKQAEAEAAGSMPNFSRLAPQALPKYSVDNSATPQHKVGDIVYVKGQKGQVLPNGQIRAVK